MKLLVVSHKPCWSSPNSPSGYATDGGFPFQMRAISELFDTTTLMVPCAASANSQGEIPLAGHQLSVMPLTTPVASGLWRKFGLLFWLVSNGPTLVREFHRADAVHAPIPGDIGTFGMLLAFVLRKPLFVRHCGNWFSQTTVAEHFWKWFMERFAGGRNVMLATGGAGESPSRSNRNICWIFSTSLTERELKDCLTCRTELPAGRVSLIIVCRQDREKGTGTVIESLPLILKDFPQATLEVVGDGPDLPEFKRMADANGVSERITFHGKVNHESVISLLRQADLFCYPTVASEGFPKVVHEALACGLPVVTTRVSVLPELIGTECGILLDDTNPATVAKAVKSVIQDVERYHAMSAQAGKTARKFSLEQWRDVIGDHLRAAWGPLRSDA
jgi:glycosyltransferase involved in cell wall biosynthesis